MSLVALGLCHPSPPPGCYVQKSPQPAEFAVSWSRSSSQVRTNIPDTGLQVHTRCNQNLRAAVLYHIFTLPAKSATRKNETKPQSLDSERTGLVLEHRYQRCLSHRDKLGRTSLHLVIINWPITMTTQTKPSSKFWTTVVRASRQAEACLRLLCEHGADVNAQMDDQSHQTPLHLSVRYRALSAARLLISCGANVNAVDSSGMTPLHMAASILHQDIASSLISHGAHVNMRMHHSGNTPLHLAAVAVMTKTTKVLDEDVSCVYELLERGAKPNIVNEAGMSPFHQVCSLGNEQLVDLLLRYAAGVNKPSAAGESCLFLFLNHTPNMRNGSLLIKLLTLSTPLTVCSHDGRLPSTLTQPRFFKQREQLIQLTQQQKTLRDICKSNIYLKHIRGRKEELRKVIPESLYNFVFNQWKIQNLSFVTESEEAAGQCACT
ncbi:ankyrin repeat domain-containing protein 61 isoform X1 [Xiphophorus maculatus]|uniref:ankyrin repeat domain-containing protein 61 isoform X1 n=1 Tax=Xiphophorus maculatus TaxID=8083 RepID=UPI000C6DADEC|nr:ankyrin repeat domain-containing protein 61 isoform X1 [Xiphophorus maculatus]